MSVRYEGAYAAHTNIEVVPAGTELGYDDVAEGHVALVFGYDEVFYIEGTPEEVRRLLTRALGALNKVAPIVAGEPADLDVRHYDAGAMG